MCLIIELQRGNYKVLAYLQDLRYFLFDLVIAPLVFVTDIADNLLSPLGLLYFSHRFFLGFCRLSC